MKGWHHNNSFEVKNGMWLFLGLFFTILLLLPRPGRAAFLDRSGLKVDRIIKDLEISLIRHDFHPGATTRTYYFKGHATYEESDPDNDGKIISSGPVTIEDVVTWNSKTHRLTCRGKESYGGHTITSEVIYECENMDPFLAKTLPNCKLISSNFGGVNYLPVIWGDNRSAIQIYRDSIPSNWRFSMILEALAKSMHLEIDLEEHLFLLQQSLRGLRKGQSAYLKSLSTELRVLVCFSSNTEGLLWQLTEELNIQDEVFVHQPFKGVKKNHPLFSKNPLLFVPIVRAGMGDRSMERN